MPGWGASPRSGSESQALPRPAGLEPCCWLQNGRGPAFFLTVPCAWPGAAFSGEQAATE